jgi:hypothetical protein
LAGLSSDNPQKADPAGHVPGNTGCYHDVSSRGPVLRGFVAESLVPILDINGA